jgi:adenylosuccinate lyase
MVSESIFALSPIDGRYATQTESLQEYFSEFALFKYRVKVEIQYLLFLHQKKIIKLNKALLQALMQKEANFSLEDAIKIKDYEKVTNHDVKAVEYFIKDIFKHNQATALQEWVHFGLTSQDINNTAIPLSIKDCTEQVWLPTLINLQQQINQLAKQWARVPMLARTHGQPASPTTMGKELKVFAERINKQINLLMEIPYTAKFGGATGNFNAHHIALPKYNWPKLADEFVFKNLGLERITFTTQIEPYDHLAAWCDAWKRIHTILIDFCRDVWQYISLEYFKQKTKAGEIGSSAMPHKVNPIDFENAEGNLGIANALLEHFAAKLPISRLQRDLTDSTVLRNIGVPVAHGMIALLAIEKGLNKLILNKTALEKDLNENWAVVAEAIQTVLRAEGINGAYELLKEATRGKGQINQQVIQDFIKKLKISKPLKAKLLNITPHNYIGMQPL